MSLKKSGILNSNKSFEKLVEIIRNNFKNGRTLKLKNENELREGKFTLKKRNQIFNIFDRKLMITEINGKITDNQITYKIEMSLLMKFVFLFDIITLFFISIGFLYNEEYEIGFVILGFVVISILAIFLILKSEINYLENLFQEEMQYI